MGYTYYIFCYINTPNWDIMNAVDSMKSILKKIIEARNGNSELDFLKARMQNMDDEKFNYIIYRLNRQIEIVKKYNPKVRPAIDPMVSSELGVYSGLDFPEGYGRLLNYPKCCIKSFENARFGIDKDHLKEVEELKREIIDKNKNIKENSVLILPSGFIPCSLKCKDAWERNLIAVISYDEYVNILKLEEELFNELPHFHGAYNEYYEKILLYK